MDVDQALAFRLARSGLAIRSANGLAQAAACPASDFVRDAALLALAARAEEVSREAYRQAVDAGAVVVAHIVRGAIHALAADDFALYGRALVARDDAELGAQLGRQIQRLSAEKGFAPTDALDEVTAATKDALANGRRLDKDALHEALRARVGADLMRLWDEVAGDLAEVGVGKRAAWLLRGDVATLESPPRAEGIRLIPPGDPYLQQPNRPLLAPTSELRKRLFRPVGNPGAVLRDGRLVGLWRPKAKGGKAEIAVESLDGLRRRELEEEAQRVAQLRGASEAALVLD